MNSMSGIQNAAIDRAKRGDFTLADALEVKHRIEHDCALCGVLFGGRLGAFVYGIGEESLSVDCVTCDGMGTVDIVNAKDESDTRKCELCGGDGSYFDDDLSWLGEADLQIVMLNGDSVDSETLSLSASRIFTRERAVEILDAYAKSLKTAPEQGALSLTKAA